MDIRMKVAVLMGCNYPNTTSQLNGCINDILLMKTFLQRQGYRIIMLNDAPTSTLNVTLSNNINIMFDRTYYAFSDNLINIFRNLSTRIRPNDQVHFHFSGHGVQFNGNDAFEQDGKDEYIVAYNRSGRFEAFSDNTIHSMLNLITCNVTAIFDCCHSQTITDQNKLLNSQILRYNDTETNNIMITQESSGKRNIIFSPLDDIHPKKNRQLNRQTNTSMLYNKSTFAKQLPSKRIVSISGCDDDLVSYDTFITSENKFHGALTYAFTRVYRNNMTNQELIDEITKRVYEINGIQSQKPYLTTSENMLFRL